MSPFLYYLQNTVVFLIMLSVLVAAHEYGHYLFARLFGMGVEEFAIGMGKKLAVWRRTRYEIPVDPNYVHDPHEVSHGYGLEGGDIVPKDVEVADTPHGRVLREGTEFTFRMLPIGGFVRIKGMIPQEDGSEVKIPGGFYSKAPWKRLIVLFGGPVFSVLAGMLMFLALFLAQGAEDVNNRPILGNIVVKDADGVAQPAFLAQLQPGDEITSIAGVKPKTFYDLVQVIQGGAGKELPVTYLRGGTERHTVLKPKLSQDAMIYRPDMEPTFDTRPGGIAGIYPASIHRQLSFGEALGRVAVIPQQAIEGLGRIMAKPTRLKKEAGGAVTMFNLTGEAAKQGIGSIIGVAAMISISLGIFNLLPAPPLDGGQMVMAIAEIFRGGRRLSLKVQQAVLSAGLTLVALMALAILTIDVTRNVESAGKPAPELAKPLDKT